MSSVCHSSTYPRLTVATGLFYGKSEREDKEKKGKEGSKRKKKTIGKGNNERDLFYRSKTIGK